MKTALEILLVLIGALLSIPVAVLFAQCVLAILPKSRHRFDEGSPRTVVLIPAHNEEAVLGKTLASVTSNLPSWIRILVVADNCTDPTAAIARTFGVDVIERTDPEHRGKGYALQYGLSHLKSNPPDVVEILDADCTTSEGALSMLAQAAHARKRPMQADNLVQLGPRPPVRSRISTFAFVVRNRVRPRGLARIGMPCQLMGTGMAVPFAQLVDAQVGGADLVEDRSLGMELASRGYPPFYLEEAHVISVQPDDATTALGQRRRWEQGHLRTLFREAPRELGRGLRQGSFSLVAMALDLLVPPLASLVLVLLGYLALSAAAWVLLGSRSPFVWAALESGLTLIAVFVAWIQEGRAILKPRHFLLIPLYVAWKIPLYISVLFRRSPKGWQRTARGEGEARPPSQHS